MYFFKKLVVIMGVVMLFSGCSSSNVLKPYADNSPKMHVKDFFNGQVKAWGIVQDRSGEVIRRFEADLTGTWEGNQGTLAETFRYKDGEVQDREWTLNLKDDNSFTGTASDIVGTAEGHTVGNAMRLQYVLTVPVGGKTYDLTFDDRMWLINENTVMNRAVMKKFGFRVAELTVFMQKQQ